MSRRKNVVTTASFLVLAAGSAIAQSGVQSPGNQVAKGPTPKTSIPSASRSTSSAILVDLNSASKQALMTLPGINDVNAQKIIENRPYSLKSELTQKKVISPDTYAKIEARIVAKRTIRVSPGNVEKRAASSKGLTDILKK